MPRWNSEGCSRKVGGLFYRGVQESKCSVPPALFLSHPSECRYSWRLNLLADTGIIPERWVVKFKPGQEMKARVLKG